MTRNCEPSVAVPSRAEEGLPPALRHRALPNDAPALARWLIGKRLFRQIGAATMGGRIVETEAYLADDPASHSFPGLTARNRSMFARKGRAYVYRIYGMWFCLNVSAGPAGLGAAVLIRAIEPEFGADEMRMLRGGARSGDLARGPGRLCAALDIDHTLDGLDLCNANGALWIAEGPKPAGAIGVSTRIGLTNAADAPLRFYERGNAYVSGPKRLRF